MMNDEGKTGSEEAKKICVNLCNRYSMDKKPSC